MLSLGLGGCAYLGLDAADREPPEELAEMSGGPGPGAPECLVVTGDAELVAETETVGGVRLEWWQAPTDSGGLAEIVVTLDAGRSSWGSQSCAAGEPGRDEGALTWTGGGGTDSYVVHGGRTPDDATRVVLTFAGQPPVPLDVDDGVYFAAVERTSLDAWAHPDEVEALDDGNVLATWDGSGG